MIGTYDLTDRTHGDEGTATRQQRRGWSRDAEAQTLGACLMSVEAVAACRALQLRPEQFADRTHAAIFRAVLALDDAGTVTDSLSVAQRMMVDGATDHDATYGMLTALEDGVPSAHAVSSHAAIVQEYAQRRMLQATADSLGAAALDPRVGIGPALDHAEQLLFAARPAHSVGVQSLRALLPAIMEGIEAKARAPGQVTGVQTPFPALDRATFGWQPGQLVIVAARPSVGKTAFALQCATTAAKAKTRVLFVSLEMSALELGERLAAQEAEVPLMAIRGGTLADHHWPRLAHAVATMAHWRLGIEDLAGASIGDMRSRARRVAPADGVPLGLVVVDYLQLMTAANSENRQNEVSCISRGLKSMAKELRVPVIALSQLSRGIDTRGAGAEPQLSDLRDSGAIEQDADIVMFLHRPNKGKETDDGSAVLLVGKNRQGPLARIPLQFRAALAAFELSPTA